VSFREEAYYSQRILTACCQSKAGEPQFGRIGVIRDSCLASAPTLAALTGFSIGRGIAAGATSPWYGHEARGSRRYCWVWRRAGGSARPCDFSISYFTDTLVQRLKFWSPALSSIFHIGPWRVVGRFSRFLSADAQIFISQFDYRGLKTPCDKPLAPTVCTSWTGGRSRSSSGI